MQKVAILFPNNNASRLLCSRLLHANCKVSLYTPCHEDAEVSGSIIQEMAILAVEYDRTLHSNLTLVGDPASIFTIQTGEDFSDADVLVLPSLDVMKDKPDQEYNAMLNRTFKEMKRRGLKIKESANIIFGGNQSGIIAASQWIRAWPEHASKVLVISSLYDSSIKIFGATDASSRALPLYRKGVVFFSNKVDNRLEAMGNSFKIDDYSTIEAILLHKMVNLLIQEDNLDEFEIIGKYVDVDTAAKYNLEQGTVAWVPSGSVPPWYLGYCEEF